MAQTLIFDSSPDDESAQSAILDWRHIVLQLSRAITAAAAQRPALAPILMESFDHALEQLLLFGDENDLLALESWLSEGVS